jgi:hypothetical protein
MKNGSLKFATKKTQNNGGSIFIFNCEQVFEGENVRKKLRGFMDPNLRDKHP